MSFLSAEPLDPAALVDRVLASRRGAVTSFLGVVRDHHAGRRVAELDYSAYGPMAEAECASIVAEAEAAWPVSVALAHRIGRLAIGDLAVAVVVAGDHRDEAFAACRSVIEAVKSRVPIWKRERYEDGTEAWVDPTAASGAVPVAEGRLTS